LRARLRRVTYDVAVWEGERPADDADALVEYERMWEQYEDSSAPASPRILEYIKALTTRYPDLMDLPEDAPEDTAPWADGPLTGNVVGPFFYFALTYSGAEAALPFIADTARAHGLVCFDPQRPGLLT
jgi:hypothetical protein